jgi:hypothetical protein
MDDPAAGDDKSSTEAVASATSRADRAGAHPGAILLLMVLCAGAFVGAAVLAVMFGDDVAARVRFAVIGAASLFAVAALVCLVTRGRRPAGVAFVLAVLAVAGGLFAAVEANRQYQTLREQFLAGRPGPVVTRVTSAQTRQLGRNVLVGIAASLATITGVPLAVYFALRAFRRAKDEPDESPSPPVP